jgi:ubiquinone/menaquinone biosynthesis C-methylase UbiE
MMNDQSAQPFPQEILDWYTNTFKESNRLSGGLGLIEQVRIHELILRHLCPPPAVVYDLGGGTGVHSFWLAGLGFTVHLVDIVPLHIEQARLAAEDPHLPRLASLSVGDARKLEFEDESADAVLLFGPLYHLLERADRLQALAEARRVLRPGGILFAYAISRYASTMYALCHGLVWDADYLKMVNLELASGQHRKPENLNVFTTAFFHHPDELRAELDEAGMRLDEIVGIQGPGWIVPDFEANLRSPERLDILVKIARSMEKDPLLSPHMLAVARRPG